MANEQVQDVIRAVRNFHRKLADIYQSACDHTEKERLKMLLHYMSRHEKHLEECLLKYEREGSRRVLNSWSKLKADDNPLSRLEDIKFDPDATAGEVIDQALRIDAQLVSFYKHLADHADSEEVRDLFSALHAMEIKCENALVRDAIEMEDN